MKKIATSWIVSVAIVLLAGCSPNGDDLPAPGSSDDIIYYDYHGDSITYPQTGNYVQSGRVAVNASTGNVIWEKPNPNAILNNYLGYSSILTYARSFEQGDFIIKIYPSSPIPSNDHNSTKVDGVYFHKINRNTGQEIVFKKIIQANEITASNKFAMSRVETDGTNFYFSLNANAIYCINANGDLVWKKDGYPAANVDYLGYYFGYSLVYYDSGRIYFTAIEPTLSLRMTYGLNAATGQQEYLSRSVALPNIQELIFTTNRVINVDGYGNVVVYNKQSGGPELDVYASTGTSSQKIAFPIGPVGTGDIAYMNKDRQLAYVKYTTSSSLNSTSTVSLSNAGTDQNNILSGNHLYVASSYGVSYLDIYCLKVGPDIPPSAAEVFKWKKSYLKSGPAFIPPTVFDYQLKGDKLYVMGNFHIQGANAVTNSPAQKMSILVFNAQTGEFIKELTGLPQGSRETVGFVFAKKHV